MSIGQQAKRIDQQKAAYDLAQKLGECVERMVKEDGWKNYFIPAIQKKRDDAQAIINALETDERTADFMRGLLETCDFVLNYAEDKIKAAEHNMRRNVTGKLRDAAASR